MDRIIAQEHVAEKHELLAHFSDILTEVADALESVAARRKDKEQLLGYAQELRAIALIIGDSDSEIQKVLRLGQKLYKYFSWLVK